MDNINGGWEVNILIFSGGRVPQVIKKYDDS